MAIDFDDLDANLDAHASGNGNPHKQAAKVERMKFPCASCAGTGVYRGVRVHQQDDTCFACGGRGYHLQAPEKRKAANAKRKATKARKLEEKRVAFQEAHGELLQKLHAVADWNSFALSLMEQFGAKGELSANQIAAAERMLAKVEESRKAREAEKAKAAVSVDLSPIKAMFDNAVESGLKRTTYRAEGVILSRAPDHGRNAGALYVKRNDNGEYAGKVLDGRFMPVAAGRDLGDALKAIAADPREAAVRWGKLTGSCSCCGRELTNAASIEAGIGPICADKWGL